MMKRIASLFGSTVYAGMNIKHHGIKEGLVLEKLRISKKPLKRRTFYLT